MWSLTWAVQRVSDRGFIEAVRRSRYKSRPRRDVPNGDKHTNHLFFNSNSSSACHTRHVVCWCFGVQWWQSQGTLWTLHDSRSLLWWSKLRSGQHILRRAWSYWWIRRWKWQLWAVLRSVVKTFWHLSYPISFLMRSMRSFPTPIALLKTFVGNTDRCVLPLLHYHKQRSNPIRFTLARHPVPFEKSFTLREIKLQKGCLMRNYSLYDKKMVDNGQTVWYNPFILIKQGYRSTD